MSLLKILRGKMSVGEITKKVINTPNAPAAIGPYSQAIQVDRTLYVSGQIGLKPDTGEFAGPDVKAQADQALKNMSAILSAADMTFNNVVKTTVLLADINDFATVNEIYQNYFEEPYPARAAYAAANLPKLAKVEIEAVAVQLS